MVCKTKMPEYRTFACMKQRCRNPKHDSWPYYGGRGIDVKFETFEQFFVEVGPKPTPKHSIDRINGGLSHYEPGNVRWATQVEQVQNSAPKKGHPCKRRNSQPRASCRKGHLFTPENTALEKTGKRRCLICSRESWRRSSRKKYKPHPQKLKHPSLSQILPLLAQGLSLKKIGDCLGFSQYIIATVLNANGYQRPVFSRPQEMQPGEKIILRYHGANEEPPCGWVDVATMGDHHWRGKIIQKLRWQNK